MPKRAATGRPVGASRGRIASEIYRTYLKLGLVRGLYTVIRMMLVPFARIEELVPKQGKILDLGCGNGLFSHFMHLTSPSRSIVGVDIDENRIRIAQLTVSGIHPLQFCSGDVSKADLCNAETVTLIDLLHHMPYPNQETLLQRIYRGIEGRGIVVIKDLKKSPLWKYALHYVHDTVSYKGRRLYFRSSQDMMELLASIGFRVEKHDIDAWNIYPHVLYRCEKGSRP